MIFGHWFILAGLFLTFFSSVLFIFFGKAITAQKIAKWSFILGAISMVFAEITLLTLLFKQRYDVEYVFRTTDHTLSPLFRLTGGWAAQEGSFMLWAFYTALLGIIALPFLGKKFTRPFLAVYSLILASIIGILAYQSPFINTVSVMKQAFANTHQTPTPDELQAAAHPKDGRGMNASLENYWMSIHPPIVFFGFASLGILFAYAMAALLLGEYEEWARRVRPWAALSAGVLGFGITLGGFWAYETLGWGGFWAWDPVENVSFLPWLGVAALLHGLYLQVSRAKMTWLNLFMGGLPFLLFAYGTFITRSGVLANTSVHAFTGDLKSGALVILLWLCRLTLVVFLGLCAWRGLQIRKLNVCKRQNEGFFSKETAFKTSVIGLLASTLFTAAGTFLPLLLTQWLHTTPRKVETSFYLNAGAVVIIPMALFMAIGPYLSWKKMKTDEVLERVLFQWVTTLIFALWAFFYCIKPLGAGSTLWQRSAHMVPLLIASFCFFALLSNLIHIRKSLKGGILTIGGVVTHVGVAVLMLGLVLSTAGERKVGFTLIKDQPVSVLGYTFQLAGMSSSPDIKTNRILIHVDTPNGKQAFTASPQFYMDARSSKEPTPVRWPWIKRGLDSDFYVSISDVPQQIIDKRDSPAPLNATFKKDEIHTLGDYKAQFLGFLMDKTKMGQAGFTVGAQFNIETGGKTYNIEPQVVMNETGSLDPAPVQLPNGAIAAIQPQPTQKQVVLMLFNVPGKPATFLKKAKPTDWIVPLELFYKPMTSLVWAGAGTLLFGGLLASRRRALDARAYLKSKDQGLGKIEE